jgi:hypothetical protein
LAVHVEISSEEDLLENFLNSKFFKASIWLYKFCTTFKSKTIQSIIKSKTRRQPLPRIGGGANFF